VHNRQQHILILSSWYPNRLHPNLGNFVKRQAELIARSYRVTVIHVVADPSIAEEEICESMENGVREFIAYFPAHQAKVIRKIREFSLFNRLLNRIDRPDLIHGHVCLPKGYLFLQAKKHFNAPLIITEHGSYFQPTKQSKWRFSQRFLVRRLNHLVDGFIAVSDALKRDMETSIRDKEINIIPNPVNTALFVPRPTESEDIHFLHVSTLDDSIKNVSGIIEAFHQVYTQKKHSMRLTIVSDEPYEQWIASTQTNYPDLPVQFIGPLNEHEIVPYFQSCSAFVLFSRYETFSIVLAEALSCGKPIITTPVGIASQLSGDIGIEVKVDDIASLVRGINTFLNNPNHFQSTAIRAHALQFDEHTVLDQLNAYYERFLA
jgi:glycosyltransferase involved in cell wall biosynthesis